MVSTQQPADTIVYPEEDGKVSESAKHYKQGQRLTGALDAFFAGREDVFVGGNLFVFYQQGDPTKVFSPDVMVVFGVRPRPIEERGSFKIWEEDAVPGVIIELTSKSTWGEDIVNKQELYAHLGVREYYLFDPLGAFLTPRLWGFQLTAPGHYERMRGDELDSPTLGLRLVVRDGWLRLLNPATGALLPTLEEAEAARQAAEAAREQEHTAPARGGSGDRPVARRTRATAGAELTRKPI